MLNVSNLSKLHLSTINLRTITSEEREAAIREVIRRAHAGRAKVMYGLVKRLRSCLSRLRFSGAPSRATAGHRPAGPFNVAMSTNSRNIRALLVTIVLGLVVVTTLTFQYRAVAKYIDATQGAHLRSANLGDNLPGLLGNGLTTVLW